MSFTAFKIQTVVTQTRRGFFKNDFVAYRHCIDEDPVSLSTICFIEVSGRYTGLQFSMLFLAMFGILRCDVEILFSSTFR